MDTLFVNYIIHKTTKYCIINSVKKAKINSFTGVTLIIRVGKKSDFFLFRSHFFDFLNSYFSATVLPNF